MKAMLIIFGAAVEPDCNMRATVGTSSAWCFYRLSWCLHPSPLEVFTPYRTWRGLMRGFVVVLVNTEWLRDVE
jgi:hypothetical protein